ncbi:MAG: sel1 repeat family protein [Lachnospiraceae bacterium]|nr:sel1 repeat family protein [Lachnospiraceae bacterium]
MEKKKTTAKKTLTEAKLRKLARLETGFDELLQDGADIMDYMPPRRKLAAAPEDLLAALDKAEAMPFETLETRWTAPLLCGFGVFFHLFEDPDWDGEPVRDPDLTRDPAYPGLPGEPEITARIWEDMLMDAENGEWYPEVYRRRLSSLIAMRAQAVPVREYEDEVKEEYIDYYSEENHLQEASEKELLLYVLYADELAGKKSVIAMRAKARGHFGGDKAYAVNWTRARDLYLQLMELDDDNLYSTMLGHIYYAGRTNNGKPQMDKAFYYYTIGTLGGNDEAKLRLADMFRKGEGTIPNQEIARRLVNEEYDELLPFLAEGVFDSRFPEAAWRKGEYFRELGYAGAEYTEEAYRLFLQAAFALEGRRKIRDGEAEKSIGEAIGYSLKAVEKELTFEDGARIWPEEFFADLLDLYGESSVFELDWKEKSEDKYQVTVTRISLMTGERRPILATVPGLKSCRLLDKLTFDVSNIEHWESEEKGPVRFDDCLDDAFLWDGREVLACEADWKLKWPKEKKA